jgi:hypothetical protein
MVLMWHIIGDMWPCANMAGLGFCLHVWRHHPLMKVTPLELGTCHHQTWEHWCTPNKVYYFFMPLLKASCERNIHCWFMSVTWQFHSRAHLKHPRHGHLSTVEFLPQLFNRILLSFLWVARPTYAYHKHIWQGFQLQKVCRILVELHLCCKCLRK